MFDRDELLIIWESLDELVDWLSKHRKQNIHTEYNKVMKLYKKVDKMLG